MRKPCLDSLKRTRWALTATLALLALPAAASAQEGEGVSQNAPTGVTLNKGNQTIQSAQRVDLTRDFATLPLHRGTAGGETVWFVVTDVSDAGIARQLGINHSPKL